MTTPFSALFLTISGLALLLAGGGCTIKPTIQQTTDTTSNVTGTTSSAHSWVTEDGLLKPEHKAIAFITVTHNNVQQDLASGQGEYLAALGTLLEVPAPRQAAYGAAVQSRYAREFSGAAPAPAAWLTVLTATAQSFRQDAPALSQETE